MTIITILGALSLFTVLWLIASSQDRKDKEITTRQVEALPLAERERRRRRVINDAFGLGFHLRDKLEKIQEEDQKLSMTSYYLKGIKTKLYGQQK